MPQPGVDQPGVIRPKRNRVNLSDRRIRRLVVGSLVRHLSLKVSGEEEYKVGAGRRPKPMGRKSRLRAARSPRIAPGETRASPTGFALAQEIIVLRSPGLAARSDGLLVAKSCAW